MIVTKTVAASKAPEFTELQVLTMLDHQTQTREATKEGTHNNKAKREAFVALAVAVNDCDATNTYVYTADQVCHAHECARARRAHACSVKAAYLP